MVEYTKSFGVGLITLAAIAGLGLLIVNHPNIILGLIVTYVLIAFSVGLGGNMRRHFRKENR